MLFSMLQLLVTDIMLFISAFIFGENFGILGSVSGNIWIAWLYMGIADFSPIVVPKLWATIYKSFTYGNYFYVGSGFFNHLWSFDRR